MKKHTVQLLQSLLLSTCLLGTAHAATYTEVGDTGELLGTAQVPTGTGDLTHIYGYLGENGGLGDVDLYRIMITDPAAFSVTVSASLSVNNDATLWLFSETGRMLLRDDDAGVGYLPRFSAGLFSAGTPGVYYLGINLFATGPNFVEGNLSDWAHFAAPLQTGNYTLALTGTTFVTSPSAVPVPAAAWLLGSGLVGLMGVARRKQVA